MLVSAINRLQDAYETDYPIFHEPLKAEVEAGQPYCREFCEIHGRYNERVLSSDIRSRLQVEDGNEAMSQKYIEFVDQYNDQDDNNAELVQDMQHLWQRATRCTMCDELGNIGITIFTPMDAFMIYDDSVSGAEWYLVRLYRDSDQVLHGSVSDETEVRWFAMKGKLIWE